MKKRFSKKKNVIFLLILLLSIGFAALAANMYVNGYAFFRGVNFDVHFENIVVNTNSVPATNITMTADNTIDFSATLEDPGQYFEFTVDVKNDGDVDAMVNSIQSLVLENGETTTLPEYATYTVSYEDGKAIQQNHLLVVGDRVTYKVRVTYNQDADATEVALEGEPISFRVVANYVRANQNATEIYTHAKFDTASNVNSKIAAAVPSTGRGVWYDVVYADTIVDENKIDDNKLSSADSAYDIYGWYDSTEKKYYIYTPAEKIYFPADSSGLFANLKRMNSLDTSKLNTSKVTKMSNLFLEDEFLSELDFSFFNTKNVNDMSNIFSGCESLENIDLRYINTDKVTNMSGMFAGCNIQNLDVSLLNTHGVTDMSNMFKDAYFETPSELDLSFFDTSEVTNMSGMFGNLAKLTTLDVSNFDTKNVTDMSNMFSGLNVDNIDLSNFDTSNVTNMFSMFRGCNINTLDISSFDMSNVVSILWMFNTTSLKTVYVSYKFNYKNNVDSVFGGSTSLIGGNGTVYDDDNIGSSYAKPDGYICDYDTGVCTKDDSVKGYFTLKTA